MLTSHDRETGRTLVATWGGGGNLPPLLAAGRLLAMRGFDVRVAASAETEAQARAQGLDVRRYRRAPDPDPTVPFEAQAERIMAQAAGIEIAAELRDLAEDLRIDLLVADCMLPAALAAGEAAGVPTASVVHFPYALARSLMAQTGGSWTTDRSTLNRTRGELGLDSTEDGLTAWESPELLLVTLPRWFDATAELPGHVLHAGPLGVRVGAEAADAAERAPVVAALSTTRMDGQAELAANVCAGLALAGLEAVLTLGPALDRSVADRTANVSVVDWADHDELMSGCQLVITHGGLGTTLWALAHGRPLLVLPLGRDQHFNADRVQALGAGITLPCDSSPSAIANALRALMTEGGFREAAQRAAARIAAEQPDATAGRALARLARR
jgi:UDP:flavonoid glycosyltransferase YjiC (YdhE family)